METLKGTEPDYERYGEPGFRIPGSRFYRAYCIKCSAPLRVSETDGITMCEDCDPPHKGCTSPPSPLTNEDEYSSSWKIASGQN